MKMNLMIEQTVAQGISIMKVVEFESVNRKGKVWLYDGMDIVGRTVSTAGVITDTQGMLRLHPLSAEPVFGTTGIGLGGGVAGCYVGVSSRSAGDVLSGGVEDPHVLEIGGNMYFVDGFQVSLSLSVSAAATGAITTTLEVVVNFVEVNITRDVQSAMIKQLQ